MKTFALALAVLLAAAPAAAANLVTNGDFEAGNSGFTSAYTYQAPGTYGNGVTTFPNLALDAGLYAIDTSAYRTHFAWVDLADKTSGTGNYLIFNGATSPLLLWEQTVAVTAGTTYNFSAWVADTCCLVPGPAAGLAGTSPPSFIFSVFNGVNSSTIGTFSPSTYGVWQNVGATFNSGSATSLTLRIFNTNTIGAGNDGAIDDISLAAVPEPRTWAMMLAGFGAVGLASRRRARRQMA